MFQHRSTAFVAPVLLVGLLAGCGSRSSAGGVNGGTGLSLAYANAIDSAPLFAEVKRGVVDASSTAGMKLKTYDNNLDGATALQNANLIVQAKPDVALEYNAVEGAGKSIGATFQRSKISCIAVNVATPGCAWFNLINRDLGRDTAKSVAQLAKKKGWTGRNTTVVLVQSATAGVEVNDSVRYFYTTIQDLLPGATTTTPDKITPNTTQIGPSGLQVDGKGSLDGSFTAVRNALQTIPATRNLIVYSINDDSTIGASRAVTASGRDKQVLIAGLGGGAQGLQQLRTNPSWIAEGDIFSPSWGQYLTAMAVAVKQGAKLPDITTSPQIVLTKDTVSQYYHSDQTRPYRLPPLQPVANGRGNDYLAATNVLQKFHNVEGLK